MNHRFSPSAYLIESGIRNPTSLTAIGLYKDVTVIGSLKIINCSGYVT
jgi:hypothetical protein